MKNIFLKKIGVNFSPLKKRRKFLGALWRFFYFENPGYFFFFWKRGSKTGLSTLVLNPVRGRRVQVFWLYVVKFLHWPPDDGQYVIFLVARWFPLVVWVRRREVSNVLEGTTWWTDHGEGARERLTSAYGHRQWVTSKEMPHGIEKVK